MGAIYQFIVKAHRPFEVLSQKTLLSHISTYGRLSNLISLFCHCCCFGMKLANGDILLWEILILLLLLIRKKNKRKVREHWVLQCLPLSHWAGMAWSHIDFRLSFGRNFFFVTEFLFIIFEIWFELVSSLSWYQMIINSFGFKIIKNKKII